MNIVPNPIGDVAVVELPLEELDASNAADLKRDMAPVLDSFAKVALGLGRLRFLDSSGLGAFLSCLRKLNAKGGDLKLYGMSKPVRAMFELVRMHKIFEICATQEEALNAFNRKA